MGSVRGLTLSLEGCFGFADAVAQSLRLFDDLVHVPIAWREHAGVGFRTVRVLVQRVEVPDIPCVGGDTQLETVESDPPVLVDICDVPADGVLDPACGDEAEERRGFGDARVPIVDVHDLGFGCV